MATKPKTTGKKTFLGSVHCTGLWHSIGIINDVGGTSFLSPGVYRVRLLRRVYDSETGVRCTGELLDPADIANARRVGTTGFTPDDYRKYGRERYEETRTAAAEFDPSRVYFSVDDFTPQSDGNAA